jgi:AcrR family transcriptional regulator
MDEQAPTAGTHERILDAAFSLFCERGIEASTTREIAQRAEVNEVTVFRHFGSKEGLVAAILDRFLDTDASHHLRHVKLGADLARDLELVTRQILDLHRERGDFIRFIMTNLALRPEYAAGLQAMNATMGERLQATMAPLIAPTGLDPRAVVIEFVSPILLRTISRVMLNYVVPEDEEEFIRSHVEVFRRALTPVDREGTA